MTNDYYNPSGWPATGASGASASARAELQSIQQGFDKLPALTGNAGKAVIVNAGGTAMTVTTGTLTLAGNFATSGAYAVTLTATGATGVTLPTSGTLATLAGSETLSNKTLASPTVTGTMSAAAVVSSSRITATALTANGAVAFKTVARATTEDAQIAFYANDGSTLHSLLNSTASRLDWYDATPTQRVSFTTNSFSFAASGVSNAVVLTKTGTGAYGLVALNGDSGLNTTLGMFGGDSGDPSTLYLQAPSAGSVVHRIGGNAVTTTTTSGFSLGGYSVLWNESGVRSWTLGTATVSGKLTLTSGDGSGTFRIGLPAEIVGTLEATSSGATCATLQATTQPLTTIATTNANVSVFKTTAIAGTSNVASLIFQAKNGGGSYINYGTLEMFSSTTTAGAEVGTLRYSQYVAGASTAVLTIVGANTTLGGSLTTSAPSGGAGAWKLGVANSVSPTAPNRTITVNVDGATLYIHAKTTND